MTIIYLWSHQLPLRGFVFFLQARLRPRSRATAPRYHGGAAWRRPSSESVCCCCTGCCCITAASQRAAGRCCTCTTRWSLLSETRWGRSPSWARAKVQKHILTHTQCFVKLNALKNQTAALQLRQVENYFSDQRRPNICSQKSAGFHFSQTQLESFFFL